MIKRFKWWVYVRWCWIHNNIPNDIYGFIQQDLEDYFLVREDAKAMKRGIRILTEGRE